MKSSTKVLLVACAAGLMLTNCKPQATVNTTIDADGTVNMNADDGDFKAGNQLPADWPADLAAYPGAAIQFSGSAMPQNGKLGWALVLTSTDSTEQVKDYYTKYLGDNGWTIVANMASEGTIIVGATKDTRAMSLTASSADGQTTITLGVGNQK